MQFYVRMTDSQENNYQFPKPEQEDELKECAKEDFTFYFNTRFLVNLA